MGTGKVEGRPMAIPPKTVNRRAWLAGALSLGSLPLAGCLKHPSEPPETTATDFSRSFCYYIPKNRKILVRIQIECRCQVFDRSSGQSDEYFLTVRTQTGLRTDPPSDHLDPGYDFWMIFSGKHVLIRRVHASSYNLNPSRPAADRFHSSGWRLQPVPARLLSSGREIGEAVRSWRPLVAVSEFVGEDPSRGYRIEFPVKWADGNPDDTFRVETGPVVLLDPDRVEVGRSLEFDDFQWAYLDFRSLDRVRCFLEKPTSILSGATYRPPERLPRRHPSLTGGQVARIRKRLFSGWKPPLPFDQLRKLFQTDHHSAVDHRPVSTNLYALDSPPDGPMAPSASLSPAEETAS